MFNAPHLFGHNKLSFFVVVAVFLSQAALIVFETLFYISDKVVLRGSSCRTIRKDSRDLENEQAGAALF